MKQFITVPLGLHLHVWLKLFLFLVAQPKAKPPYIEATLNMNSWESYFTQLVITFHTFDQK